MTWVIIGVAAWSVIVMVAVAFGRAAAKPRRSPFGPVQKWGYRDNDHN